MANLSSYVPPRRRPYFLLGLRGLISVVLVLGVGLGWLSYQTRVQRDSVIAIESLGGHVVYDWESKEGVRVREDSPPWPSWLVKALGRDYFGSVVAVRASGQFSHFGYDLQLM